MANFREVLSDKAKYPDAAEIVGPDGTKWNVGELRAMASDQERSLFERNNELNARKAQLDQAQNEVSTMYSRLQVAEDDLRARAIAASAAAPNPGTIDYRTDPYIAPLFEEVQTLRGALTNAFNEIKNLRANYKQATEYYLKDKWRRDAESIPDRPVDDPAYMQKLLRYSVENGIVDSDGAPDLRRAHERMSEPLRIEAMKKEAKKEGYDAAMREISMRSLGKPSGGPGAGTPMTKGAAMSGLDEAFEAAAKDVELLSGLQGADAN